MDRIHLDIAHKAKGAEVTIQPVGEDCSVCDLCLMALSWLEMDLPFQIYVPCRKETLIKIGIHGTDRHIQFRVVCQDMIRRLSLFDQRRNDLVLFVKFPFGHVDPGSGIPEFFPVFPVSKPCVIRVFVGDGAVADLFGAAVADIRSPVKSYAALFFEVPAGLITGRAGSAFDPAQDNLSAGVGLLTVIAVDTEVFGIIEGAFVIPVRKAVGPDFFRDRGGILAQEPGNIFKRCAFVQLIFDIDTVFKGKVFLVARNIFTHHMPPSTAVRRRDNHTMNV